MRNEIKESMNALFEHAQLEQKVVKKSRKWTPIFITIGAICVALFLIILEQTSTSPANQANRVEEPSIFELKNSYVGNPAVSGKIAQYTIPNALIKSYSLDTKEEPYGVTLFLEEDIPAQDKLKYAFYSYVLIQNHEFITFNANHLVWTTSRQELEELTQLKFQDINEEETLLAAYYAYAQKVFDIPQIETTSDHMYKLFFKLRQSGEAFKKALSSNPNYVFYLDEETFYLWIKDEAAYFVSASHPLQVQRVVGESFEEVKAYLNNDKSAGE